MQQRTHRLVISILALAATLAAGPAAAQKPELNQGPRLRAHEARSLQTTVKGSLAEVKGFTLGELPRQPDKVCQIMTMSCGTTVNGSLTGDDCVLGDDSFIDFWEFQGAAGQAVTISMMSSEFDTYLFLIDPLVNTVAFNDDGLPPTNSQIVHTLDSTGLWTIGANSYFANTVGAYTLMLECAGAGLPARPTNLSATTLSSTEVELRWRDNSTDEEEFRVEVRDEGMSFVDIGSVPADSTGVDVVGLLPETAYDFRVRARNAVGDSDYSNVASATTFPEGSDNCSPTPTNLCLLDGRFKVEVEWRDFNGNVGSGRVVPFGSPDAGLFYFFAPDNWEMLVKMVRACREPFNSFWVFAAATTNVEYTLTVTDTDTGLMKEYINRLGVASPAITDTSAFATCP